MKNKIWIAVIIIFVIVLGLFLSKKYIAQFINDYQLYNSYLIYTKVESEGVRENNKDEEFSNYLYYETAYTEDGEEKKISFYGMEGKPLAVGTYLKLHFSNQRDVISWEIISKEDLPKQLQAKIQ